MFSRKLTSGTTNKKYKKYIIVEICPNSMNGLYTCLAANCIKTKKLVRKIKKAILLRGLNCIPFNLLNCVKGIINKIKRAENIAIDPFFLILKNQAIVRFCILI